MLVDDLLPAYDVSDTVAVVVEADVATTWDALMAVDLLEIGRRRPLVAALGALRMLPALVPHLLATIDAYARRWLRRYWTLSIGSGAHVLVDGLLDVTREAAESRSKS